MDRIDEVVRAVGELPDRSSPEDWPEAMLVTADELRQILEQSDLARDAARYRWMRNTATGEQIDLWSCRLPEQQDEYADKGIALATTPNTNYTTPPVA